MDQCTPKVLIDLYSILPSDGKVDFLNRLARIISAEGAFLVASELSRPELFRYSEMVRIQFPTSILVNQALQLAKDRPDASDDEFAKEVFARSKKELEDHANAMAELAKDQLKEQRDRKSDPEIVRRNVEICDLRKQDPKKWSLGRLAKNFGLGAKQTIKRILEEEDKWRRLAAQG